MRDAEIARKVPWQWNGTQPEKAAPLGDTDDAITDRINRERTFLLM